MSQPGFVMVVENDENGKERPLAGIVGGWIGLTPCAIDLISRFCHFTKSHDLKNYKDHVLFGTCMMIYAKGSLEDEDLEELKEYYPDEKFEEKSYDELHGDPIREDLQGGLVIGNDCLCYEGYDRDNASAKLNISTNRITFNILSKEDANPDYYDEIIDSKLTTDFDNMSMEDFYNFETFYNQMERHYPFYINNDNSFMYVPIDPD